MIDVKEAATRYLENYDDATLSQAMDLFLRFPRNYMVTDDFVLIFFRLSDMCFNTLKKNPKLLLDNKFLAYCIEEDGENFHLLKGFGKGIHLKQCIKRLKLEKPKTISFYRNDLTRLHLIYKRRD